MSKIDIIGCKQLKLVLDPCLDFKQRGMNISIIHRKATLLLRTILFEFAV